MRFVFSNATTGQELERVDMSDCESIEQAVGARYGSGLPAYGLTIVMLAVVETEVATQTITAEDIATFNALPLDEKAVAQAAIDEHLQELALARAANKKKLEDEKQAADDKAAADEKAAAAEKMADDAAAEAAAIKKQDQADVQENAAGAAEDAQHG